MATFLTKPAVQGFLAPSSTPVGPTGYIDRARGRIMGIYNSTASEAFFDFFTGALISSQDLTAIGVYTSTQNAAIINAPDGKLWCPNAEGPVLELCQVDPTTTPWTLENQWGTGGVPDGVPFPSSMAWLQIGNGGWLLSGNFSGGHVEGLQGTPGTIGFWGHNFDASDATGLTICTGPQGPMSATAYWLGKEGVLGQTVFQSSAASYDPDTWPTPNGGIVSIVIDTYAASDFDAAWGAITEFDGPAFDSTDGNVIVEVSGTGGGNPHYIAKLSTATGDILWQLAIPSATGAGNMVQFSRIVNGLFLYYVQVSSSAGTVYAINTADGTYTTRAVTGLLSFGSQASDDVLGCIIGQPQWDTADGNLLLLGDTADTGNTLAAVYFIESMPIPPPPLSPTSYTRIWGQFQ